MLCQTLIVPSSRHIQTLIVPSSRHIQTLSRLHTKLSVRCISYTIPVLSAKPGTPKPLKKTANKLAENETSDRRILLFKRKRNYWQLFRLTGLSMWLLGVPLAINFLDLGWDFKIPKFMLASGAFFFIAWYAAAITIWTRQVRHLEYSPLHKRLYFTTIGASGRPVTNSFRQGEVAFNDSVSETERVYLKILNKEYVLQLNKGELFNEDLLWKLVGRKDFDDRPLDQRLPREK